MSDEIDDEIQDVERASDLAAMADQAIAMLDVDRLVAEETALHDIDRQLAALECEINKMP